MHLVCRIANALLALQSAGHARYITWTYSFYCECDVYSVLENQATKMEKELKDWTDEIAMSRDSFRVLNLFTNRQLRVIREQLGQLNCDRITSIPPTVISMLMSISPKICEQNIKDSLQSVRSKGSLVGHHSSKSSENKDNSSSTVDHDDAQISRFNPDDEVSIEAAVEKLALQLIDQLSDIEKNVYDNLKGIYQDGVIYLSIINCIETSSQQVDLVKKASAWCLRNNKVYANPEKVLKELQSLITHNNESIENEQNTQYENDTSDVVQSQDDTVYVMEKTLIGNSIPSGLAREAAEKFPGDIVKALKYCLTSQLPSTDGSR